MKVRYVFLTLVTMSALVSGFLVNAKHEQSVDESPQVIAAVAPATYPAVARAANARGQVIIAVRLDTEGNVLSAKLLSGHPLLGRVSEEAVKQWKFSPLKESTKERVVRLTFDYRTVDKGPNPKNEFTTVFRPPYEVEIQAHPRIVE